MRFGIARTFSEAAPVDEDDLHTTGPETLRLMVDHIQRQDEPKRTFLQSALLQRLEDIGTDIPCNTGCVQRILDTPNGIDPSVMANHLSSKEIGAAIREIHDRVRKDFREQFQDEGDEPEYEVRAISLQQELVQAQVRSELITQRRWDALQVEAGLNDVVSQMDDEKALWQ